MSCMVHMHIDIREEVGDRNNRSEFMQCVSRKHVITKQDVRNIRSRVKDPLIMRHKHDPTSVSANITVSCMYMYMLHIIIVHDIV